MIPGYINQRHNPKDADCTTNASLYNCCPPNMQPVQSAKSTVWNCTLPSVEDCELVGRAPNLVPGDISFFNQLPGGDIPAEDFQIRLKCE